MSSFGRTIDEDELKQAPGTFAGTPEYMAPEVIREVECNCLVDWWSLGIMLFELACGHRPFPRTDGGEQHELFLSILGDSVEFSGWPKSNTEFQNIINRMLDRNPKNRVQHSDEVLASR